MKVISKLIVLMAVVISLGLSSATAYADDSQVTVDLIANKTALVPGETIEIGARFKIEKDWHIYYKEPGETGRATTVDLTAPDGFSVGDLQWQKPKQFTDFGMTSYGYADETVLKLTVQVPADLKPGESVSFKADITWLACKTTCIPGDASLTLELPVVANAAQATDANQDVFGGSSDTGKSVFDGDLKVEEHQDGFFGFMKYVLFAFIGGLILNLMPCVLPVVSMKVLAFVKKSGKDRSKILRHGLTYAMGTVSTCLLLAFAVIGAQIAGYSVGWGFQFQQPIFLLVMATLVTVMSLGLFGVFMVNVNSGAKLQELSDSEGYSGSFFTGVLATILSTPCTAPFLGTAIGFAFAQPWWGIILIFASIGAGLAFPYVLLSMNPAWQRFIPKPGAWMESFKQGMGFLFLFSAVWLLYVLGQQVGTSGLIATLVFIIATSFGAWMIGTFADFNATKRRKIIIWLLAGIISASTFWYFTWEPVVNPAPITKGAVTVQDNGITWQKFSKVSVDKHLQDGKVVFIDFTADWCQTCKLNEATVLASKAVGDKFADKQVVALKGDWTLNDPEITEVLKKFNRSGVPLYIVMSPHRPNEPIVLPELLTESMVTDAIDSASKQ